MIISLWKQALSQTFTQPKQWLIFLSSSVALFLLLLLIPVWTTPGNDLLFQISLLGWSGNALVAVLSLANGLLITMQVTIREKHKKNSLTHRIAQATTLTGILTSSLAATIACAACYSSLLSFIGLGTTVFVIEYRLYIALFALTLTATALHYSSKRLTNACTVCHI